MRKLRPQPHRPRTVKLRQCDRYSTRAARLGCFDWDPIAALLYETIEMVRQDAPWMLDVLCPPTFIQLLPESGG